MNNKVQEEWERLFLEYLIYSRSYCEECKFHTWTCKCMLKIDYGVI